MVIKFYVLLGVIFFLNSCVKSTYRLENNEEGEVIIDKNLYTFTQKLSDVDFKLIDTTSLYIEIFDGLDSNVEQRKNPIIFKFHNDGYYKEDSYLYYGKFDKVRNKNSAYYGGKYYIKDNTIFVESFYPTKGSKTKYYNKVISKGVIKRDTIEIVFFGTMHKYVKKNFTEIFNK